MTNGQQNGQPRDFNGQQAGGSNGPINSNGRPTSSPQYQDRQTAVDQEGQSSQHVPNDSRDQDDFSTSPQDPFKEQNQEQDSGNQPQPFATDETPLKVHQPELYCYKPINTHSSHFLRQPRWP
jgi:hypothetical protein